MRPLVVLVLITSLLGAVASGTWAAPRYDPGYINARADTLLNTNVTVRGLVMGPRISDDPYAVYRHEYFLQDEAGTQLLVQSKRPAPEQGKWVTVTGTVKTTATGTAVLQIEGGLDLKDWRIWALTVLIIVAVVLIFMLVSSRRAIVEPGDVVVDPPPPTALVQCSSCGHMSPADGGFCENCGASLVGFVPPPPPPPDETVMPGTGDPPSAGDMDTVMIVEEPARPIAHLLVTESPTARVGEEFRLSQSKKRIGRREGMDIRLLDETVSREHAIIWWADGGFLIQDDASSSGTFVNGERITAQVRLQDGDGIRIGKTKLVFRLTPVS